MTLAVTMRQFAVGWDGQQMAIRFGPGTLTSD
jgi:hypothetical protein